MNYTLASLETNIRTLNRISRVIAVILVVVVVIPTLLGLSPIILLCKFLDSMR